MSSSRRAPLHYAVTILALGLALFARGLLDPLIGSRIPFALNLGAVALGVGIGGLGPALLAAVLGYFASDFLFVEPRATFKLSTTGDWITLAGYMFACSTIIVFGLLMRRAHRRLQSQTAEMQQVNLRKDELLATVAHELRQPLAPLHDAVQMLNEHAASSEGSFAERPARQIIERQLRHLTRLIDDLVDLDRLSRGQVELRRERLAVADVLEFVVATCRPLVEEKRQVLETDVDCTVHVEADPMRLEQVFVNLLHNACKFTPPEGRIRLSVRPEGKLAVIAVTDSGIGLPPDAAPHVFDLFYQRERRGAGSGIGLAIVRRLVTLHDGSVMVQSSGADRGCEFSVRLPLADRPADSPQVVPPIFAGIC